MTTSDVFSLLLPGDCLLYRPMPPSIRRPLGSLFGAMIAIKTWHGISHCELYMGNGLSFAARDGIGVGKYPWRNTELAYILRPVNQQHLDWLAFHRWFNTVNGEGYDWSGLVRFLWFRRIHRGDNRKMFCSEALTRAYRVLKAGVFSATDDADAVAPFEFLVSPALTVIATPTSLRS